MNAVLWLALAALAGGPTVGGSWQPARLLFLGISLALLLRGHLAVAGTPLLNMTAAVGVLWVAWGVCSWAWTPEVFAGAAEVLTIFLGFLTILAFISLVRRSEQAIEAIRRGWVSAFLLTLPVAIWELATDSHLVSSMGQLQTGGESSVRFFYAAVTFGNRNNYATFIVLCFPFLLWSLSRSRKLALTGCYAGLLLAGGFLVAVEGTRLGTLALMAEILMWLLGQRFRVDSRRAAVLASLVVLALVAGGIAAIRFQPASLSRIEALAAGLSGSSTVTRVNLGVNGLELFKRSGGIGVGAGGFENAVLSAPGMRSTEGIANPHNLWVEIAAQYGVVVVVAFVGWLAYLGVNLVRAARYARGHHLLADPSLVPWHAVVLLVGLPPAVLMSSSLLQWTILWASLASIAAVAEWSHTRFLAPGRDRAVVA